MLRSIFALLFTVNFAPGLRGQEGGIQFEVASVTLHDPKLFSQPTSITATEARFFGSPLLGLLAYGFNVQPYQIKAPANVKEEMYDVLAKLPSGTSVAQVPSMLQALLAERLNLRSHWENRLEESYVLTGQRSFMKVAPDDEPKRIFTNFSDGTLDLRAVTVGELSDQLTACCSDRPIVDESAILGRFNFKLLIGREGFKLPPVMSSSSGSLVPNRDPDGTSWAKAIEAYGLKSRRVKRPMKFLVIDSVNRVPTPN